MTHVNFVNLFAQPAARLGNSFCAIRQYAGAKAVPVANCTFCPRISKPLASIGHGVRQRWAVATRAAMSRKLVWIQQQRCWGCSECVWVFQTSTDLADMSFGEMMRNFELQRDKEFTLHVCADHPRTRSTGNKNVK